MNVSLKVSKLHVLELLLEKSKSISIEPHYQMSYLKADIKMLTIKKLFINYLFMTTAQGG